MEWLTGAQFSKVLASPLAGDELDAAPRVVVVDWSDGAVPMDAAVLPAQAPVVVVGITPALGETMVGPCCDVIVSDAEAAREVATVVEAQPVAAAALVVLLRRATQSSIVDDLVAESATYSALQASEGHQRWLARRPPPAEPIRRDAPMVEATRHDDRLDVVLACPERRNALSAQMRDELIAALAVAVADPSIHEVAWRAEGPAFCSGGDLDEFGTGTDPGANHLVRLARSVALPLVEVAHRVTVHVHGSCVGAGVELPAFAGRVVAAPDTTFRLPELEMGLVPGAGGTASLPRRAGRHRTAWLALTGRSIDAHTALRWGLVDAVTR